MDELPVLRQNVGDLDRLIRIGLGVALMAYPVLRKWPAWGIAIMGALGGVQILEGIIRY